MKKQTDFERASQEPRTSLLSEFWTLLVETRNRWLVPIVLVLAIVGLLAIFAGTGAAPFIYTMF